MSSSTENGMYRVFQLIRLLNSTPRRTARQLMHSLELPSSTFYRHLKLLERLGYCIEKDANDCHFLQLKMERGNKSVLDADELFFLQEHLQQYANESPQAQTILHKFDLNLSMIPLADSLPQLHASRIIQLLRSAIELRRCVLVKGYHSLSSNETGDRRVEPLELTEDYRYLIGWDMEKDRQSQYKLARIQDVDFLDDKVTSNRTASPMDIFGLTGESWQDVQLKLSSLAYHLMVEEFPRARPYIKRRREGTFFEGPVRNWKGIGRFVLGLPGEVEVIAPDGFKAYLAERMERWKG